VQHNVSAAAALYVHLPWCVRKCPYCDFNSFERKTDLPQRAYVTALLRDLDAELGARPVAHLTSIFLGGGTPSLFDGDAIATLLDGIAARCSLDAGLEVTLEANPGSVEAGRFRAYCAAGVNRLSLGIQSFDPVMLTRLGRIHDADEARRAIALARAAGVRNLNLDLMFGLTGAPAGHALADLEQAIAQAPEHISWYQLTLEAGTQFARYPPALPDHDTVCDDYEAGLMRLAAAGFEHYEVSAFARRGCQAAHNLNYWRFGDYIGIGAGAHGMRTRADGAVTRTVRVRHPERYMKLALAGAAIDETSEVSGLSLASEFMLNGLRLKNGFTLALFEARTGLSSAAIARPLREGQARGWLSCAGEEVRPTAIGFRFLTDLQLLFMDLESDAA
jgi:oxygen-independent coproporphyrinogen-3 oxidase